jgi:polysaccharide export outer membrane protein
MSVAALVIVRVSAVHAQEAGYLLNPGDILEISVWKEEDLQREVLVLPDGTISFPLAGHIKAAGYRPIEIQRVVTQRLEKFIQDLVVTVSVRSSQSREWSHPICRRRKHQGFASREWRTNSIFI